MKRDDSFTLGLVQMRCDQEAERNMVKAEERVREAAQADAQIVLLPELFLSPYFCQRQDLALFDLAEPIPGPSTERLAKLAKATGTVVVASLFERRTAGVFHNTAVVFDCDGTMVGVYRKMHIPDDPLYFEKYYFTPGDLGFRSFDTKYARVAPLVCWDQWYPEAARLAALRGAAILFYPTAIGWHPREKSAKGAAQREAWRTIQRGHAIASGVFVAAVNRVGLERPDGGGPGIEFWGSSFLCDPFGTVLAEAAADREETLIATVDLAKIEETRRGWPFLRDRRIDAYGGITQRFLDEPSSEGECGNV
jgi:N-carbamoylputrescine amidase